MCVCVCVCVFKHCDYGAGENKTNKVEHIFVGNILFTKVKYHNDVVFDQS